MIKDNRQQQLEWRGGYIRRIESTNIKLIHQSTHVRGLHISYGLIDEYS